MFGQTEKFLNAFAASVCVFLVFPEIDINISELFYHPVNGFFLRDARICQILYKSVEIVTPVCIGILITMLIWVWITKISVLGLTRKSFYYLILVLALGPGLLANTILKDNWGRARPDAIVEFGGDKLFTPAFILSSSCNRNCSFVSGHSAMAFYVMVPGFLFRRYRKQIFGFGFVYGSVVGLARMVQGGHFLSDVVFSFFCVFSVAWGIYHAMFERGNS
ncbi:MAG: phosphatase PAP2 family protein [Desulfatirhabdiaceae bacterium]